MPGLVPSHCNALSIGQIPDAGVFQSIKLIPGTPSKRHANRFPFLVELVRSNILLARHASMAEYVTITGLVQNIKIKHQHNNFLVQYHISVLSVFGYFRRQSYDL